MVAEPVSIMPPGSSVQTPGGNPLISTLPMGTKQVGCEIGPTIGTPGLMCIITFISSYRAHVALEKLHTIFDVIVSGDGEIAIFEAIKEGSSKLIDGDDPKNGLFMNNESYDASPYPARHLVDINSYKYS